MIYRCHLAGVVPMLYQTRSEVFCPHMSKYNETTVSQSVSQPASQSDELRAYSSHVQRDVVVAAAAVAVVNKIMQKSRCPDSPCGTETGRDRTSHQDVRNRLPDGLMDGWMDGWTDHRKYGPQEDGIIYQA